MGKTQPAHLRRLLGSSIYIFEGLSGLQIMQVAGSNYVAAEILGPDIEICAFAMGEGKKERKTQVVSFAKAQSSSELSKTKRKTEVHQSFSPQEDATEPCNGQRFFSAQPMCFVITLLISRQTKFRSSSIFSLKIFPTFIFCILIAPCGC